MPFEMFWTPSLAEELDCYNPWFYVVAMNGGGSAYGLYLHPTAPRDGAPPWVLWEHENDALYYLAPNTEQFFGAFLRQLAGRTEEEDGDRVPITRTRQTLADLGLHCLPDGPELCVDTGAVWLPPDKELLSVEEYLAMSPSKPAEAERGLLAHSTRRKDARAHEVLGGLYKERGWLVPGRGRMIVWPL